MILRETMSRLAAEIDEGLFTRGVQVSVSINGEQVLDHVLGDDGLGRPVAADTLFRVYCTLKPITAIAVAHLVATSAIDLDRPLSATLPEVEALKGGVTTRHVLNHTAGLHQPAGVTMEMVPPEDRDAFLNTQARAPGWRLGSDAGYSEHFGWHVLGRLLERVTGERLRDHLRRRVLDPLGMRDTYIGMTTDELDANLGRVGLNVDLRGWRPYPLLFERTPRVLLEVNPAHGGYTTARDLELLYRSLLRAETGEHVDGLPPAEVLAIFCRRARTPSYDVVLARECDYGLGFMTNLPGHHFGPQLSTASYGHSGNVGSSFALADPASRLAIGVVFNGIVDPDSAFLRRPALVRAICRDLDLASPAAHHDEDGSADVSQQPAPRRRLLRCLLRSRRHQADTDPDD